jgi:uncharacterized protein
MLTDSALLLPCFAPPRSFAALMTVYESNYIRLRALMPALADRGRRYEALVSRVQGDVPLHVAPCEHSRYTTTLHMTYFFDDDGVLVADPDLHVRIYHDARMAEALACGAHAHRHPLFTGIETQRGSELQRRWSRNMMLNKWLEYCADRGHRLVASPSGSVPASVLPAAL